MNTQKRKLNTDFPPSLASAHPVSRTDRQLAEEQVESHRQPPRGVEREAERPCASLPGQEEEAWEAVGVDWRQGRLAEKARLKELGKLNPLQGQCSGVPHKTSRRM